MTPLYLRRIVLFFAVVGCQTALVPQPALAGIRAGFADRDITPAIGMERPGGYGKAFHRSFHDPCKVRAAVFDDGTRQVAIVGIDALMIHRDVVLACRQAINEKCGIPGDAVMLAASHSHSSGPSGMVQPGQFDNASELIRKLTYEDSSMADPSYLRQVKRAIVDAVCSAHQDCADVVCGFGSGQEDQVAFNRRFRMRSGFSMTHPRQGNPDMLEFAGPVDPEVGVVGVWNQDGSKLIG